MKHIFKSILILGFLPVLILAYKKNLDQTVMTKQDVPVISLSASAVTLTQNKAADTVATITWSRSDYGFSAAVNYAVEIVKAGSGFNNAPSVNVGSANKLKYLGAVLNDLAIGLGIPAGTTGDLSVRVRSSLSDSLKIYSQPVTLKVTTYQVAFPALLVRGGNGWVTPAARTNGFLLASPNFNTKYEGYLYLPNADGWGGDALKLESTSSGVVYGWGTSSTTLSAGGGNLWLTPTPNYMKVNADVSALTISYIPAKFYVTGDNNGWSTSATPMTYDPVTRQLVANNVTFAAGNKFAFTANGGWDLSYKVDNNGKLVFSGPPGWAGNNIAAPATGTYTVILDLSGGDGSYTYKLQ